jgi:Kef-type K+ transport system membrane component KefB
VGEPADLPGGLSVRRLRSLYGASPLHLLALAASLALTVYVALKIAGNASGPKIALWIVGAALAHDLVLWPLYTALDRIARGRRVRGGANHLRVPAAISALLALMWAGLIFQLAPGTYQSATGLRPEPYLERWLAVTAALFLGSAVLYAVRARRRRR